MTDLVNEEGYSTCDACGAPVSDEENVGIEICPRIGALHKLLAEAQCHIPRIPAFEELNTRIDKELEYLSRM